MRTPSTDWQLSFSEVIGKGGFGAVYAGTLHGRNNLVQRVAVKVLHRDMNEIEGIAARQRDEARLLAQLNHDHIVRVIDLIEVDGCPAVIMEFVDGIDCQDLAAGKPLPARAVCTILANVASALHAAYSTVSPATNEPLRAVHRDIKPGNVLVTRAGGVKLLDFGIARADFKREQVTVDERFATQRYMPPEFFLGEAVGPAADIYALAVTAWELLTGEPAARLPAAIERFDAAREDMLRSLQGVGWSSAWRIELLRVLRSMMQFDPAVRITAHDVEDRFLQLAEEAHGLGLVLWARRSVPEAIAGRRARFGNDDVPGTVKAQLTNVHADSLTLAPGPPRTSPTTTSRTLVMVGGATFMGTLFIFLGTAVIAGVGWWSWQRAEAPALEVVRVGSPADELARPVEDKTGARSSGAVAGGSSATGAGADPAAGDPARRAAESKNAAETRKAAEARKAAGVREASAGQSASPDAARDDAPRGPDASVGDSTGAQAPPEDAVVTYKVTFSSVPMGGEVFLDGVYIGKTPVMDHPVSRGNHDLRIVTEGGVGMRTITANAYGVKRYIWKASEAEWGTAN